MHYGIHVTFTTVMQIRSPALTNQDELRADNVHVYRIYLLIILSRLFCGEKARIISVMGYLC